MRTQFKTETGSLYVIDDVEMVWERLSTTEASGFARTASGPLTQVPVLTIGESAALVGPPFVEGAVARVILTSRVVEVGGESPIS
jgi:hypothetical protein